MNIEIEKGNLFDSESGAIILTVDGASKGMEGNIARAFGRLYPDIWEELEYDIEYPIALGSAKIYSLEPDLGCKSSHCIIASTLNHIDVIDDREKLEIISQALRASLSLAANNGVSSVCTGILAGGWRLEIEEALEEMLTTYQRAKETSVRVPVLKIYVLGSAEFERIESYLAEHHPNTKRAGGKYVF